MRLKANDTLHVSSVKADNILPNEEFDVADDTGAQLIEKGLATEVAGEEKAAPEHKNKAAPAPKNKSASAKKAK